MIPEHGGNVRSLAAELGCPAEDIIDMSSNLNPFGPPPGLLEHLQEHLREIYALPEMDAAGMIQAFADFYDLDPARVQAGNGTTQLIDAVPQALNAEKPLILAPTYSEYARACRMHHLEPAFFAASPQEAFQVDMSAFSRAVPEHDLVFICNPNNPTGVLLPRADILALVDEHPRVRFVIDESYLPFVPGAEEVTLIHAHRRNLFVCNSMSKIFRIPGLRVGFLIGPAERMPGFTSFGQPWSVNALAQAAVCFLMRQKEATRAFVQQSRALMLQEKARFLESAAACPDLCFFPGATYFVLAALQGAGTVQDICRYLSHEKILIRDCGNFEGLPPGFLRISLKTRKQNQLLVDTLLRLSMSREQLCSAGSRL